MHHPTDVNSVPVSAICLRTKYNLESNNSMRTFAPRRRTYHAQFPFVNSFQRLPGANLPQHRIAVSCIEDFQEQWMPVGEFLPEDLFVAPGHPILAADILFIVWHQYVECVHLAKTTGPPDEQLFMVASKPSHSSVGFEPVSDKSIMLKFPLHRLKLFVGNQEPEGRVSGAFCRGFNSAMILAARLRKPSQATTRSESTQVSSANFTDGWSAS